MQNSFSLISKHRQALMGYAIIWILLFHLNMHNLFINIKPVYYFLSSGYAGVDIFLFLSGFGLYYTSLKPVKISTFYAKRFIRIMPAFAIVLFFFQLLQSNYSIKDYFLTLSSLNFWTNHVTFDWYLSALMSLYLVFPFYIKIFKKYPLVVTVTVVIIAIVINLLISHYDQRATDMRKLLLCRIPVFSIGVYCGMLSCNKEKTYKLGMYIAYILSIIGCCLLYYLYTYHSSTMWQGLFWYSFILIVPGLCLLMSSILEKMSGKSFVNRILSFWGMITLELYLMHILFYQKSMQISLMPSNHLLDFFIASTLSIVFCVIAAYFLHQICKRITINKEFLSPNN